MPSIIVPNDYKKHFSINVDTGLWQDFKTGDRGNFAKFLTIVENITYMKAKEKIFLMEFLEDEVKRSNNPRPSQLGEPEKPDLGSLIPVNISSYDSPNELVRKAWVMLFERKLFNTDEWEEEPFYICTEGTFKDRLIIPYKNDHGRMFYFQARSLPYGPHPRYLNPKVTKNKIQKNTHPDTAAAMERHVKPSHILYPYDGDADYLVICEGVLDVISLRLLGINSTCTCGSSVSRVQADLLAGFEGKIILGYDNDTAGGRGIEKFETLRKDLLMPEFHVCSPPPGTKDWNEAYMKDYDLSKWFDENTHKYDYDYVMNKSLNSL